MMVQVSVIMPTYNCGAYMEESIRSVQNQTMQNWELLVVDDCSTDNTSDVMELFSSDDRIRYLRLEKNSGPACARNYGLDHASGEYIAFLDSDDLWMPDKLEKQLEFMKKQGARVSCTAYEAISEQGERLGETIKPFKKADYNRVLYTGNCLGNSTVMYERAMFSDVRVPDIRKRNDFALWLQILKKETYAFGMDDILMQYRVRENSVSSGKKSLFRYHWHLYKNIENLGTVKAAAAMCSCIAVKSFRKLKQKCIRSGGFIVPGESETVAE